ncbi:hypothetical protein P3X46_011076 [Hevea brasiliensis]|uniref:Protein CHUP1, chloroplastic n=2 Tax=Hevea brasiliensis TaxID=3981 RepID=A0ABQ9MG23_HEVBR|nr:hypothetical protein P3X46_011076 [Hevea brasiliensis]
MVKEKNDIRPVLVKLRVALALSFTGFLYSRIKCRRHTCSKPPRSPRPPVHLSEVDGEGRAAMKKTHSSGSIEPGSAESHEDTRIVKIAADNPMVLSPGCRHGGEKDGYLLPEFNDLVKEFDCTAINTGISTKKDLETPRSYVGTSRAIKNVENDDYVQEIRHLNATVRMLQEREKNLEVQLLEFCGLKEQETAMIELQNRLRINNMEAKLFNLKIESLQADNQRLQAQVADHAKIIADLDAAKAKIKLLRKMLRSESEQNKERILTLQKRVTRLQERELKAAATDSEIQLKLQKLKDLEAKAQELRESNFRLHIENSELARQLESTQILVNSVLEDPGTAELREHSNRLRQENGDLAKQVEELQAGRCTDVEELVYLQWMNACLRYGLRNFHPPHGKTVARDLSKSLSPESEVKAKQLILEYANTEGMGEKGIDIMDFQSDQWSSSHTSSTLDPSDFDDSSVSPKNNNSSKIKIFNKLRRLIRGKDNQHCNHGSSVCKTGRTEDSDSPLGSSSISTATDTASDQQSNRVQSLSSQLSWHSSRPSADIRRLKSANMYETKDIEIGRRNSHSGSSSGHRKFLSGRITASDLSPENQLDQDPYSIEKSELLKMAEVLKDSRTRNFHRKATSLGSFEAFRRTTSQ